MLSPESYPTRAYESDLSGFNRIATHFLFKGPWIIPGQRNLGLIACPSIHILTFSSFTIYSVYSRMLYPVLNIFILRWLRPSWLCIYYTFSLVSLWSVSFCSYWSALSSADSFSSFIDCIFFLIASIVFTAILLVRCCHRSREERRGERSASVERTERATDFEVTATVGLSAHRYNRCQEYAAGLRCCSWQPRHRHPPASRVFDYPHVRNGRVHCRLRGWG